MNGQALGVTLKIASVLCIVAMSAQIKLVSELPLAVVVFFRSLFGGLPILVLILATRDHAALRTHRLSGHLARGLFSVATTACIFFGLRSLPLPASISIGYLTPLLIVVMAALWLKEHVTPTRLACGVAGFGGVMVILWPRLAEIGAAGHAEALGALFTLAGAFLAATSAIFTKRLLETDSARTIALYLSISACGYSLLFLPFQWQMPDLGQLMILAGAGLAGGIGHLLLAESYRHAPMSVIAPLEYTSLLFSVWISVTWFGEVPGAATLTGSAILILSGIVMLYDRGPHGLRGKGS